MKIEKAIKIHRIVNELEKIGQILNANTSSIKASIINEAFDIEQTEIEDVIKETLIKRKEELLKQIENYE